MESDFGLILLVSETEVMIKMDNWGHPYFVVRGKRDEQLRKHLPRVFS